MNLDDIFGGPKRPDNTQLTYSDGSGNAYYIAPDRFVYSPVSPLQSSSGIYSGGKAVNKSIDSKTYQALETLFREAAADTTAHTNQRTKGSGEIQFVAEQKTVLIAFNCAQQKQIEERLETIKTT